MIECMHIYLLNIEKEYKCYRYISDIFRYKITLK